ncbi:tryptophan--tRNA ligase [bacterium (Candidatus Gribaldobacteria) CG10_big_fil_rev_8_21_14_0_10_37_21]|uniref:Tryptophan--tRNA ligase n=1 Tax=bacterium (Candidatus Gribaldobacteria) CG10_big_fil_rev_8_21_14_0_10_37_21 TaxID=2014275 RepID=A0A2H0UV46_9BACT|nr:MAG: tryptophan--tRNA ligase [bacterium (Candidatus Gribaldobacteria) CG10_big_fil_rev_8_21_14_0_10_37_21]
MKIFSGIQPTNQLHIGNYLGAIAQWIDLQKDNECIFWIADLHALTVPYQAKELQKRTLEVVATYLATGIDPEKSIIFRQSDVKEHSELAWLLSTITPVGDLERMTQFKDKSQKHKANINAGLLNYPVLMAADILLYQSNRVPVGIDQKQHIELARTIAKKFNKKFGETFIVPEGLYSKLGAKIMSLKEPTKKMSKSDSPDSFISLFDSPEQIKKKIASATTDSLKSVKYNPEKQPGIANLLTIYSLFAEQLIKEIEKEFANKGYAEFKQGLALLLIKKLKPFRDKKEEIAKNPELLKDILENGAKKARLIAQLTMQKVKQAMGLV